jgi:hypothetical protein
MSDRAKAKWISSVEVTVTCLKCSKAHSFEIVSVSRMILDGREDDEFEIMTNSFGDGYLWPQFVCRNSECTHIETLTLPGL